MYKLFAYITLTLAALSSTSEAVTVHRVRKGETLTEIAQAYKVTAQAIKNANKISNANRIKVGQELTIPVPSSDTVETTATTAHRVRKGETLTEIAQAYKVTVEAIKSANQITNANQIVAGQQLTIPAAAPSVIEYKIRRGDNLSDIAKKYGASLSELKALNAIRNSNKISIGQVIRIPVSAGSPTASQPSAPAPTQYIDYKIRRGDSLSDIAKTYGVSLSSLKTLNAIRNSNKIRIGQVIRIPVVAGSPAAAAASKPSLASSDLKTLDRTRTKSSQWRHIVIHHSASASGSAKAFDRFHREERRMENGLAYHFVIGNGRGMKDGELHIGDRWKKQIQGGHLSSYTLNQISIGICLVGDFSKTKPTAKQMATLEALVRYLMSKAKVPLSRVTTHTLIHPKHTECPGKHFPTKTLKAKLAK
ncbi:LysM domain protein [Verrucomicrobiia bacterium DG1235]|nr:LysM domain protein [Verrucomicrobiae bacterium DG1235]